MKKWLSEELEQIPCDFCGTRDIVKELIRKDRMSVVECAQCGLAYLNPRPKAEFISKFYEADYFTGVTAGRGEGGLICNIDHNTLQTETEQYNTPRAIVIINEKFGGFKGKDVLEIGCATGDLLQRIQGEGGIIKGLEISGFAADIARNRELDVTTGTVENFVQGNEKKFDIVIALEVIEHVISPTIFVEKIADLIKPGGLFLLSTPNYSCVKRFGQEWLGLTMSFEHLYFFTLTILTKLTSKFYMRPVYSESSKSLGASRSVSTLQRQVERLKSTLYFLKEIGVHNTVRALSKRHEGYYQCSIGHTITAVYKKIE